MHHQNSFVHFYIFQSTFKILLDKGIHLTDLQNSDIFSHKLEYDNHEWPQTHTNKETMIRGFNGSIFELRNMYLDVFDNLANEEEELKMARRDYSTKLYKIKYTLNLLTIMESGDDNFDLMGQLGDIEEL